MSRIRGKHTAPELIVRSLLHRLGYRFRLHVRIAVEGGGLKIDDSKAKTTTGKSSRHLPSSILHVRPRFARPDIVLPKYRVAIFVHGCFWHRHRGCRNCTTPTHRREFWVKKLEGNAARDKIHQRALRKLGWRVIVIWECKTQNAETFGRIAREFTRRMSQRVSLVAQFRPANVRASGQTSHSTAHRRRTTHHLQARQHQRASKLRRQRI